MGTQLRNKSDTGVQIKCLYESGIAALLDRYIGGVVRVFPVFNF